MPENNSPEQVSLMERMVDMAAERTRLATRRTEMAVERTKLANDRTRMSADRSQMSAERSYMAAERTLSVWVRTALALMVFGIAIDRFGLLLHRLPSSGDGTLDPDTLSLWGGAALVALGVLMVLTTGARFLAYVRAYRRDHEIPFHHGPFLAPVFAVLVALFGIALLILLLAFSQGIS